MKDNKLFYTLAIIIITTLFVVAIGITSIATTRDIIHETSYKELTLSASNVCQSFDSNIKSIEQSVNTLALAATHHISDMNEFKTNPDYVDSYTESLEDLLSYSVQNTHGAMSVYLRFNQEFTSPNSGLFLVFNSETEEFERYPVTDFSKSTSSETLWYDVPVKNKTGTWLNPYVSGYADQDVISYVVPYYYEEELVGIIGIDISIDYIEELINSFKIYDTGFAFLTDENSMVVVHKNYRLNDHIATASRIKDIQSRVETHNDMQTYQTARQTYVFAETQNNMILCVTAPNNEIYSASNALTRNVIILLVTALLVISIITFFIIRKLFSISETDTLTGLYNRKYFIQAYHKMPPEDLAKHSLFIFDIDKFKNINDTYGHNAGDKAITNTAQMAKKILGDTSIIARWGGDEFIGLIRTQLAEKVLSEIRESIENEDNPEYGKVTISIGYTHIRNVSSFTEICDRADKALYESKKNGRNCINRK